jgi:hypothetical protein
MMKIRGDRGPAIAQQVTEVLSNIFKAWQVLLNQDSEDTRVRNGVIFQRW